MSNSVVFHFRRIVQPIHVVLALASLLVIAGGAFAAMPLPSGQQVIPYGAVAAAVPNDDVNSAKPVGLGSVVGGGDTISVLVDTGQFNGLVDLYLGIYMPSYDSQNIYLITEIGVQTALQGLAPWKTGVTSTTHDVLGQIPVSALPRGPYTFYLMATPPGGITEYTPYYLWSTTLVIPPPGEMVPVANGCFEMGNIFGNGNDNELPVHKVCLNAFSIDKYLVTQGDYQFVMGTNPSEFASCGTDCPVEKVTWSNAYDYCRLIGKRLPAEAEWEYAARSGGQKHKYAGTSNDAEAGNFAWYLGNAGGTTHPVGGKLPNALGIYDMSGNVWEWVADWWGLYTQSEQNNPTGPSTGTDRVIRGGSWWSAEILLRTCARSFVQPDTGYKNVGFRCARTP